MRVKSNTYRLEELKSVIEQNIPQLEEAIALHEEIYEVLLNSETKHVNETYLSTLQQQIDKLRQNLVDYNLNLQLVEDIIQRVKLHENDEVNELDIIVTMMLHLFTDIKLEEDSDEQKVS